MCSALEHFFDKMLGLWAGNEHGWSHAKGQTIELGFAEDVLDWLADEATLDECIIGRRIDCGDRVLPMTQQPCFVFPESKD